jgi:N-acetylglutamate synthase-like GNAT family acetyltransferase
VSIYILRAATAEDAAHIRAVVRLARLNPTGLNWERFRLAVDADNKVIGCVQIKPHRDGSQELASLVVDPKYRGQGIARTLIENLIGTYERDLYLMCRSTLGDFYEKFGFRGITETQMPTYFRRISKLASVAEILRKEGESLLIMKYGGR